MNSKIRLALSGGGHRATVFSLGALLYLVESRRNLDVQTITSVSGGSLTNGYLSLFEKPFNQMSASEFRKHAASFAKQIAGSPMTWWFALVSYVLLWGIWLIPVPRVDVVGGTLGIRLIAFIALICLWAFQIGPKSQGTLWGWYGTWLYLGLLVVPGIVAIPVSWSLFHGYWRLSTIALTAAVLFAVSRRHIIAGRAFRATIHCAGANANRLLASTPPTGVRHIFCATEVHVARHIFFSHDFVFTKDFGIGIPGTLRLGDAIQLSANFPGGFPFRRIRTKPFEFVSSTVTSPPSRYLTISDGGVYDNTATSWYRDPSIPFQIGQLQRIDKLSRSAVAKGAAMRAAISEFETKAAGRLPELDSAEQDRILQDLKRLKEDTRKAEEALKRANEFVLPTRPEDVASVLHELGDPSYDLIVLNAAYPPQCQSADLVARPVLSDLLVFTKCTETLYNHANHQRLRDLRRTFLNKDVVGALVSFEEHPELLARYMSDPQQWFFGMLPEEQNPSLRYFYDPSIWHDQESPEENSEMLNRKLSQEIVSFDARYEYSPDSTSIPAEFAVRAREVIELLHPGYLESVAPSAEEIRAVEELCLSMERLQSEVQAAQRERDSVRDRLKWAQSEYETAKIERSLAEKELKVLLAKNPIDRVRSELKKLAAAVMCRRTDANSAALPRIFELRAVREANQSVATTLCPLGLETTANLLYQGYLCAMMNLHVLLGGYPLLPIPDLQDFKALASGNSDNWGSSGCNLAEQSASA